MSIGIFARTGHSHLFNDSNEALTQVETLYKEALEASRKQALKAYELRATIGLSKLLMKQKRNQEAYHCLYPVAHWFKDGFDTAEIREVQTLLQQFEYMDNNNKT